MNLPIESIIVPRKAFREDPPEVFEALCKSVREKGILVPLAVYKIRSGRYRVIDGVSRYRAAKSAGLSEVPIQEVNFIPANSQSHKYEEKP